MPNYMYHEICKAVDCKFHREWDYEVHAGVHSSTIECSTCMIDDPDQDCEGIFEIPVECINSDKLISHKKLYDLEAERYEKERMWKKLSTPTRPEIPEWSDATDNDVTSMYPNLCCEVFLKK